MLIYLPAAIHLLSVTLSNSQGVRPLPFSRHSETISAPREQVDIPAVVMFRIRWHGNGSRPTFQIVSLFKEQSLLLTASHWSHMTMTMSLSEYSSFAIASGLLMRLIQPNGGTLLELLMFLQSLAVRTIDARVWWTM